MIHPARRSVDHLPDGFTLIELLVVITIIVVLLALLTPALDKAIYSAEIAADAAQMRGITQGTLAYASGNKQRYPDKGLDSSWDAMQIKLRSTFDQTAKLRDYVVPKMFIDPFLADANLDVARCMADPDGVYMPGYMYYPDWGGGQYGITRMKKVGQKMSFPAPAPENETRRFGVVIADRDSRLPGQWSTSSHQDKDGLQRLWAYQNGSNPWAGGAQGVTFLGPAVGNVYVAWWENLANGGFRGKLDNNYGIDDGSVLMLKDVPIVQTDDDDDRITLLPDVLGNDEYTGGRKAQLPRRTD